MGQRSLAGYCPWGHKELDVTEHTHTQAENVSVYKCCLYMHINIHILTQSKGLQRVGHD